MHFRTTSIAAALLLTLGCRGGNTGNGTANPAAVINLTGSSGCSTTTPAFGAPVIAFTAASLAPYSVAAGAGVCSLATEATAFLAVPGPAPGPAILKLDLNLGTMSVFADAARFAAFDAAVSNLTGIALLPSAHATDPQTLVVVDASTNRLLAVTELSISAFAGISSAEGGYADGSALNSLFKFTAPTQPAVGGNGTVYLADPGNHRVRQISGGFVTTLAGSGVPGYLDGVGTGVRFELPDGVAIECEGTLVVTEASHRLRRMKFIATAGSAFGGGSVRTVVTTLAGNGTDASLDGPIGATGGAEVSSPGMPCIGRSLTGKAGTLFWLDRGTGRVRRIDAGSGTVDSPYDDASVAPLASFGLCGTFDGSALLTDSVTGQIWRIQ